ncbi:hypothetical protein [Rickettsia sp. MEAM1 (Bemisia tabaci)]|uniref:hypothetical protein n=1 Tax=Rickettsia sp. MEAM1 (Bemisia tabaci) TaxID=1182263 RepID=UPI0012EEC109|nr:hypothetical protein [Rickettsia sp. MEAM1 (Bemisia tabaci)]
MKILDYLKAIFEAEYNHLNLWYFISFIGTVKLSKLVSQSTIFLDFRQQEVFE